MFYRCIPNFAEETAAGVFADTGAKSFFEEIVADISGSAKEIIYMCLVALGTILTYISFRYSRSSHIVELHSAVLALDWFAVTE